VLSIVFMKILETSPSRYDRGIALLTLGAAGRMLESLVAECVRPGDRVLDVGCGTGAASRLAAARGASVLAFDTAAGMLKVARSRETGSGGTGSGVARIEYRRMGISAMEDLPDSSFDVVTVSLVMSELSHDEQEYLLAHSRRVLKTGGRIAITDEVAPDRPLAAAVHYLLRLPLLVATFVVAQQATRPVRKLVPLLERAGFGEITSERTSLRSFMGVHARKRAAP
jgi:demethylmenaquinone methyltransferase/2-methoxy-6-polyprenyl-1,4-benzoquinol methylase